LDAAGVFEGTIGPYADAINANWYASEGRWEEAAISFASIFAADILVKPGKYGKTALSSGDNVLRFQAVNKPWKQIIIGKAHAGGAHKFRTYREAIKMAKSGQYEKIYLNRSFHTITDGMVDSLKRSDIVGVLHNSNRIDMIEVVSPYQRPQSLWDKISYMQDLLGDTAGPGSRVVAPH